MKEARDHLLEKLVPQINAAVAGSRQVILEVLRGSPSLQSKDWRADEGMR